MQCLYCHRKANTKGLCTSHLWRWVHRKPMEDGWHSRKPYDKPRKLDINVHGYVRVIIPGRGRVLEHRYVMEQYLGRSLFPDELVHHLNEIKTDNRIENLELVTRPNHAKMHMRPFSTCSQCGAKQWVKKNAL